VSAAVLAWVFFACQAAYVIAITAGDDPSLSIGEQWRTNAVAVLFALSASVAAFALATVAVT
jgi:hypothetical protein